MRRRGESGQAMLLFAVGIATLVTLLAVVVNLGHLATARAEQQNAAGQAAIAAATRLNECPKDAFSVATEARARALEVAAANRVAGRPVTLDPAVDVLLGRWDPAEKTYERTDDDQAFRANAVEVLARRTEGSPDGPITLFMAGLLGDPEEGSESRSRAFGIPDGPAFMNTDLTIGLNECAVLGAFAPGSSDPALFPITLDYNAPDFGRASFAARPAVQTARDLAVCPGPDKPVFPQRVADPLYSSDEACSRQIEVATAAIRFNLFCELNVDPPEWCDSFLPDQFASPTLAVQRDLLLISNARNLPAALYLSDGDLGQLEGEQIVPVYSTEEVGIFSDFDSTDAIADRFFFPPLTIPVVPPVASMQITYILDVVWPPLPMAVRYAPTVGFARYRIDDVQPIFEIKTFELTIELDSCVNVGLCSIPDCCSLADFPFPLDVELEVEQLAGVQIDGAILRDQSVIARRAGGVNFGLSATNGRGPRLAQPSNLAEVPPGG